MAGPELRSGNLPLACDWYTSFLKSKIEESWATLFKPVLAQICCTNGKPCDACLEKSFLFLKTVVSVFPKRDVALVDIVDELYNSEVLREAESDTEHDRSDANQLAFAAFGWISLLYTPEPKPVKSLLRIFDPLGTAEPMGGPLNPSRRRRYPSGTFRYHEQTSDNNDQPIYTLLKNFGPNIIPKCDKGTPLIHDLPGSRTARHDGWIDLSLVCFDTLHNVASIKIEWVDCVSLHLEFNSRIKTLKLFRFPSMCFVMCSNRQQPIMSRLFQDNAASTDFSNIDADDTRQFFKEVILSYRLIFGQTKSSRQRFNKQLKKWDLKSKSNSDPMLYRICGHGCESEEAREIYYEIEADDPSNQYDPAVDFPFLGKRLVSIQDYVQGHKPSNFKALWYDRRNVSWWWTFWAVIIIGGLGLVLALVQDILQILQLIKT